MLAASAIAMTFLDVPLQLWHILYFVVLPMLLLAGMGYLLQRRLGLDMATLTRLNFYFIIPVMVYHAVVTSTVSVASAGVIILFTAIMLALNAGATLLAAALRRVPREYRNAMLMTTMFNNSGNYALPLQELAFGPTVGPVGMSLQVFVMIVQNFTSFTIGILLAAGGSSRPRHWKHNLLAMAKFPPVYALALAVLTVQARSWLGDAAPAVADALAPFWKAIQYIRDAFIGLALATLGAQLAAVRKCSGSYPISMSVMLRLVAAPALGLGLIFALDLHGFIAQVLLISTATPTAVNCMLLCLEFDNHPDFAARAVFYSTLLSPVTVTMVIFLAQSGLVPRLSADASGAAGAGAVTTQPAKVQHERHEMSNRTTIGIDGDDFAIGGKPTYAGRTWRGMRIEGLLMNSRMVQGIFDDLNLQTRGMWTYPDGPWDAARNTREFVAAMEMWRAHGLLSFTINLQGGSPQGYSKSQPWHNSAFAPDGTLRGDYTDRLTLVLDRAQQLGMAPILGLLYFGQDERLMDEAAVVRGVDGAVDWLLARGYANVLVEVNNECNVPRYEHTILQPHRVHELIERVQARSKGRVRSPAGRLLAGTSMGGGGIPPRTILETSDFVLLHGNGQGRPDQVRSMVRTVRASAGYRGQPILFNEDDHFDFDKPDNNMLAAVGEHASWGLFDYRLAGEGYDEGYQSVPVNWGISSGRKRGFFGLLKEMTGA
jgi:predicted permease